jgi:hypothetical protein
VTTRILPTLRNVGLALQTLRQEVVNHLPNALARWCLGLGLGSLPRFGQVVCVGALTALKG